MIHWQDFEVIGKHYAIKNKKVRAVYVTSENADEVAEETKCFAKFNDNCVCTGFMALQGLPSWLININPRGRVKKYVFESQQVVNRLLKEIKQEE
jgi:hypothetical protein